MKASLPVPTLALAAVAVVVHALPLPVATALQFDRSALARGEWWRIATGHFTHFGANHLAWDVGVLVVLGWICERISRRGTGLALAIAAVTVPLAVWIAQPQFATYRGLSGLDSALFGMLATALLQRSDRITQLAGAGALFAVGVKCAFELASGSTAFAHGTGYAPVPLAHAVGAAAGVIAQLLRSAAPVSGRADPASTPRLRAICRRECD